MTCEGEKPRRSQPSRWRPMGGFGEIRGTFGRYGEPAEQAVEAVEAAKDPKVLPRGWARVEAQPVSLKKEINKTVKL